MTLLHMRQFDLDLDNAEFEVLSQLDRYVYCMLERFPFLQIFKYTTITIVLSVFIEAELTKFAVIILLIVQATLLVLLILLVQLILLILSILLIPLILLISFLVRF